MKIRWYKSVSLAVVFAAAVQCSHQSVKTPAPAVDASTPNITKAEAESRAKTISQVDYDLEFDFTAQGEKYSGKAVITFMVDNGGRDLRVDFADGEVSRTALNETPFEAKYNGRILSIPGQLLRKGRAKLEIDFTHAYGRQGRGITRFIDPVDMNAYLYTDFEPYDANRAFPCFDQPDLKATYTVKVLAPKTWEVITSVRESTVVPQGDAKVWTFPRSARYSTYIFPLHAGAYAKWEDRNFRYPLRLFARKSLAKYVKPAEWFPISKHGFDFFEAYFGYPYPYKKYDQIIVPEFNAGAMENVAAVTFTERFVSRGSKTKAQVQGLANTILHEMAHMWFGDLVTMRWWGDLWLNESFATYTSSVAQAAFAEYRDQWQSFFGGKTWAYWEDQMITTHPIVASVKDTNEAFTSFDGITYGKGAAVLKQLSFYLGEDGFKKGLKIYFERYAEKNTEYKDFMATLAEASGRELDVWQQAWFETAGVNALSAQFQCKDGRISQFAITQTSVSGDKVVRPHATQIALLGRANGKVTVNSVIRVEVTAPNTYVADAVGRACPFVVYLNHEDYGYFKSKLDAQSAANLKTAINDVEDPLLRHQLWYALWDQVRDAEMPLQAYAELLTPGTFANEKSELILRHLLYSAGSILNYYHQSPKLMETELPDFADRLDRQLWLRFKSAKAGSNEQLIWLDSLARVMSTPWGMTRLKQLLNGAERPPGVAIDQDRRWEMVNTLARYNDPEAQKWIDNEAKRDTSSYGVERRIGATAALPDFEAKMKWVDEFKKPKSEYSFSQLRSAVRNLFPPSQNDKRELFAKQFLQDMRWVNDNKENFTAGLFTDLAPGECSPEWAGRLSRYLGAHKNLQPVVVKNLKVNSQEGERCRKIVALSETTPRSKPPARPPTATP